MTRLCSALFLFAFVSIYCAVVSAQPAPPATPSAPAAKAVAPPASTPAAQAQGSTESTDAPLAPEASVPAADAAAAALSTAEAQPPEPQPARAAEPESQERRSFLDAHAPGYLPPLYRRDSRVHRGLSIRVSAGLGYGIMRRRVTDTSSYKVRGLEGQLSLDIGKSVMDNLIVFGRFSGFAWNSMFVTDSRNAGGAYLGLLGAGARYYFMPANAFASAVLGVAALQVINDLGVSQNAYPGFGMELEAGKDFWAGTPLDQRGIGLSLRFGYVHSGSVQHAGADLRPWNSYSISVLFSAAYN